LNNTLIDNSTDSLKMIRILKECFNNDNFNEIISAKGNEYLNIDDHHILINEDAKTHKFTVEIDDNWGKKHFETPEQAKAAAFKGIEYYKEKGEW